MMKLRERFASLFGRQREEKWGEGRGERRSGTDRRSRPEIRTFTQMDWMAYSGCGNATPEIVSLVLDACTYADAIRDGADVIVYVFNDNLDEDLTMDSYVANMADEVRAHQVLELLAATPGDRIQHILEVLMERA